MTSGATFTMRLKDVLEATGGEWEIDETTGVSLVTGGNIGLNFYPIFQDDYRPLLNGKIFDHFMNREIAFESIGLFQLAMRRKMNEIMPVLNKMYESTLIEIEALSTVKLKSTNTIDNTEEGNQTVTNSSASANNGLARTVSSETPQTMLDPNEDYATSAADSNSQSTNTANASNQAASISSGNSNGESTTSGYQGAPGDLLMRYRESFINPDMMVISDLEDLFMGVWDNGDSFTQNNYNIANYYGRYIR